VNPGLLYRALAASVGIGIGASAVLLLILMLRLLLGPFDVLAGDGAPRALRVGLWEPASGASQPDWQRSARRERWRSLLPADAELEPAARLGELAHASAVAVADAALLTQAEVDELEAWIEAGGRALLAGWIASGAEPVAGSGMRRLLGGERVFALAADHSLFVAAGMRGPLSSGLVPGERIDLGSAAPSPALERADAELFWSDWALRARTPGTGAALRRTLGRGRLAWLAFGPERAPQDAGEFAGLRRVYANALAWTAGEPAVELLTWPGGAPLAGLLAMDTEDRFANASPVAQRARADGFPVTFLVLTSLARQNAALLPELEAAGEIGIHGDVHDGFAGQTAALQRERLERSRAELESLGVTVVRGFRPPYESYDAQTLAALPGLGFAYMLGDATAQSMVPRVLGPELVQVPRIPQDDHDLLIRRELRDPESLERHLLAEVDLSTRTSGLHYFSFHTQHFGDPARVAALAALAAELRARGAWLCTGSELAAWWQRRAQVELSAVRAGPQRVHLIATNRGAEAVRDLAVRLHPNSPIAEVRAAATALFRAAPEVRRAGDHVDVLLPELAAGGTLDYTLDLLITPSASSRSISGSE
jgi:peptidoglycan/xylan/chitin deacetylase (PgdA/CDA1 family)